MNPANRKTRQVQLVFTPACSVTPPFAQEWREAVASRLESGDVAPEHLQCLFHHDDTGRTAQGKARVCFIGSTKWLGAVATGSDAISAMSARTLDLVMAAQELVGPCAVEHHNLELGVSYSEQPFSYIARSFVGNESDREWDAVRIRNKLVRSLNEWAETHGVQDQGAGLFRVEDVMLESVEKIAPAMTLPRNQGRYARSRAEIIFYMPWKLHGMWFVGSQASKGHGLVRFIQSPGARSEGGVHE